MYLSISHKQIMAFSSLLITMSFLLGAVLAVHAYGSEQWQIGLSFNCNAPVSFCAGFAFWGWCAFGGSGTTGDCQFSIYNLKGSLGPAYGPTSFAVDYTGWVVGKGSVLIPTQPTLPAFAGHYTYNMIPLFPFLPAQPGINYNIQVTQISS